MSLPFLPLAHGLGQREDLPLPEDIFIITAAVVLAVSFVALAVLWPEPRLEGDRWRPLKGRFAAFAGSRGLRSACQVIGVALLAITLVAGYIGPENPNDNFASNFVFVIFWVGLVVASVVLGDVFR